MTALLLGLAAALIIIGFVVLAPIHPGRASPTGWSATGPSRPGSAEDPRQGDSAQRQGAGEAADGGEHPR